VVNGQGKGVVKASGGDREGVALKARLVRGIVVPVLVVFTV
jgi:hypothetical protein